MSLTDLARYKELIERARDDGRAFDAGGSLKIGADYEMFADALEAALLRLEKAEAVCEAIQYCTTQGPLKARRDVTATLAAWRQTVEAEK